MIEYHCLQVYMAGAQGPAANLALLDHMLAARHQLACLLGFESYAAFKAADGTLAGRRHLLCVLLISVSFVRHNLGNPLHVAWLCVLIILVTAPSTWHVLVDRPGDACRHVTTSVLWAPLHRQ